MELNDWGKVDSSGKSVVSIFDVVSNTIEAQKRFTEGKRKIYKELAEFIKESPFYYIDQSLSKPGEFDYNFINYDANLNIKFDINELQYVGVRNPLLERTDYLKYLQQVNTLGTGVKKLIEFLFSGGGYPNELNIGGFEVKLMWDSRKLQKLVWELNGEYKVIVNSRDRELFTSIVSKCLNEYISRYAPECKGVDLVLETNQCTYTFT